MHLPYDARNERVQCGDIIANRYKIVSLAGSGGMGQVYEAQDLKLDGKRWAVKEVRTTSTDRFIHEAKILSRLNHPCLPNIVDYYPPNDNGYAYLVMDFVSGTTLEQWFIANHRIAHAADVVHIALQLCRCFRYLHESLQKPIVYHDLKPSNVMLDHTKHVRLIDFGVASTYENRRTSKQFGTRTFAAPEQLAGESTDPRTDLYGIGALMYYLLSGGQSCNVTRKSLSVLCPALPKPLIRLVDQLLAADRAKRVQTAADLEQRLLELMPAVQAGEIESLHTYNKSRKTKLIVFGGLYTGAGTTFTAIQFARLLHHTRINHNVTEFPVQKEPQLYDLLDGDEKCPNNYIFYTERTNWNEKHTEWTTGKTVWRPLRPGDISTNIWTHFDPNTWLNQMQEPITIVDVSDAWNDDYVLHLCDNADLICFVADPQRAKFNGNSARKNVKYAIKLKERGKNVQFIANRVVPKVRLEHWFNAFPWRPAGSIPNVDLQTIIAVDRKGKLVQDLPELRSVCEQSCASLLAFLK